MSFNTPAGTRGGRQPRGAVARWMNSLMASRVRRSRSGTFMGMKTLVLTTVGRRSGVQRSNPVAWIAGEDGSWLIVASAAGARANPAWYYNIAAHPDEVQIEVGGRRVTVDAEQLHGDQRSQAWQQFTAAYPRFAGYQQKTDRELPVIRLAARGEVSPPG
jgi:deazaflavin-dependent oxidoreductase (nitroreductase family)